MPEDLARLVREGRLVLKPGSKLKMEGTVRRHDGSKMTKPSAAARKAKRRKQAKARR